MSEFTTRRDTYAEVGTAMRATVTAALSGRLSARECRVLLAVFALVGSYSRLGDRVSTRQLAGLVYMTDDVKSWHRRRVGDAIRALAKRGVLIYEPGVGARSKPYIGLLKAPDIEAPSSNGTAPESEATSADRRAPDSAREGPPIPPGNSPTPSRPSEKYSEELSEEREGAPSQNGASSNRQAHPDTPQGRMFAFLVASFGTKRGIAEGELDDLAQLLIARGYDEQAVGDLAAECVWPSDLRKLAAPRRRANPRPDEMDAVTGLARRLVYERREAQRPAIHACDLCGPDGWREVDGGVRPCNHTTP